MRFCIVGAGFSGAVLARELAEAGHAVLVIDERPYSGGNCWTERDAQTGILVHRHGPHIFHTGNAQVWNYVSRFAAMRPYAHRVKAIVGGRMFGLPINLATINQFFGANYGPDEARAFLASRTRADIARPANFEEQALATIGAELYRAFIEGYTVKQWGCPPALLPAATLKRLPLRFDNEDRYYDHPHQAMPEDGYTAMIDRILAHPRVALRLACRFEDLAEKFDHVFYSGPIDRYFGFRLGRLGYRTLDFEELRAEGDFQGVAVVNYCDREVPFTRITEHKHFAPWEAQRFAATICYREYSRAAGPGDVPYYPIRLADEQKLLTDYVALADSQQGVSFLGRLGTYRYLDMDVAIAEALAAARRAPQLLGSGAPLPAFFERPI